jgi:hypothetical protein
MIPQLEDGVLPEGVHDGTIDEVDAMFGRFQRTTRRIRLMEKLRAFLEEARRSGIVSAIVIDGSFVTAKDEPEDVDLVIVLPADLDLTNLRPVEYNAISRRAVRANYRFDSFAAKEGSEELARFLAFFAQVNPDRGGEYTTRARKGLVRVRP